jgi:hypothetical protein
MLLCLLIYLLLVNVISRVKYTATNVRVVSVSCGRILVGPVSRYFAGRCLQNPVSLKYGTGFFPHTYRASLYYQIYFYSPTDAQESCLKSNFKIYIKTAPTCFGAVTPLSGSTLFVLAKVIVVKIANKIHRCVVMWLYILVGPC